MDNVKCGGVMSAREDCLEIAKKYESGEYKLEILHLMAAIRRHAIDKHNNSLDRAFCMRDIIAHFRLANKIEESIFLWAISDDRTEENVIEALYKASK